MLFIGVKKQQQNYFILNALSKEPYSLYDQILNYIGIISLILIKTL